MSRLRELRSRAASHLKFNRRIYALGFVGLVALLILTAFLYVDSVLERSLPQMQGELTLQPSEDGAGLAAPVQIRRDRFGVPYVEAQNVEDLYFASGFVQAQDRLWQMYSMKYYAEGRLSEVFGERFLRVDVFRRTLGIARHGRRHYAALPEDLQTKLTRFAAGVNAFLKHCRASADCALPVGFLMTGLDPEPWKPEDSLILFGLVSEDLAQNYEQELAFLKLAGELGPERAAWLFPVYPDEPLPFAELEALAGLNLDELKATASDASALLQTSRRARALFPRMKSASNNWAVSGAATKSGRPLLANDTHLAIGIPGFWMLMHMRAPGVDAAGVMIPGTPMIQLGSNGRTAWGVTMAMADSQDLFLEELRTREGRLEYREGPDEWRPVREETIALKVKDQATPVERTLRFTSRGPLLNSSLEGEAQVPGAEPLRLHSRYGIAFRWVFAADEPDRTSIAFERLIYAEDAGELRGMLADLGAIHLNFVFADANEIGYQAAGRYPVRNGRRGIFPAPGWRPEHRWRGFVPFAALPAERAPVRTGTANHRIADPDSRYTLSSTWGAPDRHTRVMQLLNARDDHDLASMRAMQLDTRSLYFERLRDQLLKLIDSGDFVEALQRLPEDDRVRAREALTLLIAFNGALASESAETAVLGAFYDQWTRNVFGDELGHPDGALWDAFYDAMGAYQPAEDHLAAEHARESPFFDDTTTPEIRETYADMLVRSLADAIALCEERLGSARSAWEWGRLHRYQWKHLLGGAIPLTEWYFNRGPTPAPGDRHTLNVANYRWAFGPEDGFGVQSLPAMRLLVDFSRPEPVFLSVNTGQSGNPHNPHYDDQIPLFLSGELRPVPFGAEAVAEQYDRVLTLRMAK